VSLSWLVLFLLILNLHFLSFPHCIWYLKGFSVSIEKISSTVNSKICRYGNTTKLINFATIMGNFYSRHHNLQFRKVTVCIFVIWLLLNLQIPPASIDRILWISLTFKFSCITHFTNSFSGYLWKLINLRLISIIKTATFPKCM